MGYEIEVAQGNPFGYAEEDEGPLKDLLHCALAGENYHLDQVQRICQLPESYVGHLELPSRSISIQPKILSIGMSQVEMMYFFVNTDIVDLLERDERVRIERGRITEAIARRYVRELEEVLQKGLPHLYVESEGNLSYVRGSLAVGKTLMNIKLHRTNPFNCKFDEISMQNSVSKVLGAALYKVEGLVPNDFVRLARHVPYCEPEEGLRLVDPVLASGKEYEYTKALRWAERVLKDLQVLSFGRGRMGSSFLIDLNILFQDFCAKAFKVFALDSEREAADFAEERVIVYGETEDGHGSAKSMKPDILYQFEEGSFKAKAIIDCKLKQDVLLPSDIYQIEFYSTCLLGEKCILVYPKSQASESVYLRMRILDDFKRVYIKEIFCAFVDLGGEGYETFLENARNFVGTVSEIINDRPS